MKVRETRGRWESFACSLATGDTSLVNSDFVYQHGPRASLSVSAWVLDARHASSPRRGVLQGTVEAVLQLGPRLPQVYLYPLRYLFVAPRLL